MCLLVTLILFEFSGNLVFETFSFSYSSLKLSLPEISFAFRSILLWYAEFSRVHSLANCHVVFHVHCVLWIILVIVKASPTVNSVLEFHADSSLRAVFWITLNGVMASVRVNPFFGFHAVVWLVQSYWISLLNVWLVALSQRWGTSV